MRTKVTLEGKRVTKWDIANMIEDLPGNTPWGYYSMYTIYYDVFDLKHIAETYNTLVEERQLNKPLLEITEK